MTFSGMRAFSSDYGLSDDPLLDDIDARLVMSGQDLAQIANLSSSGNAQTGRDIMNMLATAMVHPSESAPTQIVQPVDNGGSTAAEIGAAGTALAASAVAIGYAAAGSHQAAPVAPPATTDSVTSASSTTSEAAAPTPTPTETSSETRTSDTLATVDRAMASYDAAHPETAPTASGGTASTASSVATGPSTGTTTTTTEPTRHRTRDHSATSATRATTAATSAPVSTDGAPETTSGASATPTATTTPHGEAPEFVGPPLPEPVARHPLDSIGIDPTRPVMTADATTGMVPTTRSGDDGGVIDLPWMR